MSPEQWNWVVCKFGQIPQSLKRECISISSILPHPSLSGIYYERFKNVWVFIEQGFSGECIGCDPGLTLYLKKGLSGTVVIRSRLHSYFPELSLQQMLICKAIYS